MPPRLVGIALLALVTLTTGCGDATPWSTDPRTETASADSSTLIGGPLGTTLEVPAGALGSDTAITIAVSPRGRRPGDAVVVSTAVRMSPSGLAFTKPIEVLLPVDLDKLPAGATIDDVLVVRAAQNESVFVPLPTRRASSASVAALTEHFSDFVAVVRVPGSPSFACGDSVCGAGEDCTSCPHDCGLCVGPNVCGNAICDASEQFTNCIYDCPAPVGDAGMGACFTSPCLNGGACVPGTGSAFTCYCAAGYVGALCETPITCTATAPVNGTVQGAPAYVAAFGEAITYACNAGTTLVGTGMQVCMGTTQPGGFNGVPPTCNDGCTVDPCQNGGVCTPTGPTTYTCACSAAFTGTDCEFATTFSDPATGLEWQRIVDPGTYDFASAATYCAALILNSQVDWRVPTRLELASIIDYSVVSPAIDASRFPSTPNALFWSSTPSAQNAANAWTADFDTGNVLQTSPQSGANRVRCVRTAGTPPSGTLVDIGDGTISDTRTGLLWAKAAATPGTRATCEASCSASTLGGLAAGQWRVPTLVELMTIVSESATIAPFIDDVRFPNTNFSPFWTSTPRAASLDYWHIDFGAGGRTGSATVTNMDQCRCVH